MQTVLPCAVMLLVVLSGALGYPESPTLYDDFNAGFIKPGKWFGAEPEAVLPGVGPVPPGAGGEASTEAIRQVEDGQLRLSYQAYGQTDPNVGNVGRLRRELNLNLQDSPAVTAIQATVEVTTATTNGCPSNPNETVAWARLGGRFFTARNSNGEEGDVVALIHLGRRSSVPEPPNVLHAVARVLHCLDEHCAKSAESPFTPEVLGLPVHLRQKVKLQVQWDKDNERFIFQRDSAPAVEIPYKANLTFVKDAEHPNKGLSATLFISNCTDTPRPVAFIDAWFDDVMVMK